MAATRLSLHWATSHSPGPESDVTDAGPSAPSRAGGDSGLDSLGLTGVGGEEAGLNTREGEESEKRKEGRTDGRNKARQRDEEGGGGRRQKDRQRVCLFVGWLLNVPATGECISGTDLLRQLYVLPH